MMKAISCRWKAIVAVLFVTAVVPRLFAAETNFDCDVSQGFNFRSDGQSSVGYITALTIGTTPLRADLAVKNPTDASSISVVGVLSHVSWAGSATDPISFTAQVSSSNRQAIASLMHQTMSSAQAQIGFVVFTYDPMARKYYKSFCPLNAGTLTAAIAKSGTTPRLTVDSSPGLVTNPLNFQMSITVAPPSSSQKLQVANSASVQVVKTVGIGTP